MGQRVDARSRTCLARLGHGGGEGGFAASLRLDAESESLRASSRPHLYPARQSHQKTSLKRGWGLGACYTPPRHRGMEASRVNGPCLVINIGLRGGRRDKDGRVEVGWLGLSLVGRWRACGRRSVRERERYRYGYTHGL